MLKPDPSAPRLTENDKEVLKKIIEHAKIPDSQIAESIGISPQAVFKIRNKLEDLGIIKGYIPIIDFKKIGINMLAFLIIRLLPEAWSKYPEREISHNIARIPYVIEAYRVAESDASHLLLMGFRDVDQKVKYISQLQTKYAKEMEIKTVYSFPVDSIITQNPLSILYEIIDKKDFSQFGFFPDKKQ
jgi:Lrp/AsnC family transcriptional regulator, leucine-responsive regulatory protein